MNVELHTIKDVVIGVSSKQVKSRVKILGFIHAVQTLNIILQTRTSEFVCSLTISRYLRNEELKPFKRMIDDSFRRRRRR